MKIPLVDLEAQQRRIGPDIRAAMERVLDHGKYILGPEVTLLEQRLSNFCGSPHVATCASGTDALILALMGLGVGPGDAVFVPSFTFVATAEAPALLGATPVFVDVDAETFLMSPESLEAAIRHVQDLGLVPRTVIPVDLFGQPCDYDAIGSVARREGLTVVADAAQSFGASRGGRRVGTLASVTTTSFFPAKPLGCYGDGGAVFSDDAAFDDLLRSLRAHGQGAEKYRSERIGLNGRLDTLQAAVLLAKLDVFEEEIAARQRVADRYAEGLKGWVDLPVVELGCASVWAQYTIRVERRDRVAALLDEEGIATSVYYPVPLHLQPAYRRYPTSPHGLGVSERLCSEVLSLPMHAYLDATTIDRVIDAVRRAVARAAG